MKKAILFSLIFLFVGFSWFLNPGIKQAEAITSVYLVSPSDSTKMTTDTITFKWGVVRDRGRREIVKEFHVVIAQDFDLTPPWFWEGSTHETMIIDTTIQNSDTTIDTTIVPPDESIDYDGLPFEEWKTYFWSVQVKVDSIIKVDTTIEIVDDETTTVYDTTFFSEEYNEFIWYKLVRSFAFLYTTATLIEIPDSLSLNGFPQNLQTIQVGIIWADEGDTVLVEPGTYYENLRFHKKGVVLASHFVGDTTNTAMIDSTIIDGDSLTRGKDYGSVIYFTSDADSNSRVVGFTIRNGKGTKGVWRNEEGISGGGILCDTGSTPTIAYNVITQNHAPDDGGGIFCNLAAPNIFNNIITQNSAGGSGGAIQCYYSIETRSPGLSPPAGEEEGEIEIMPKASPTATPTELNRKAEEGDLENSLYPRDATEVFSAPSSDPLAKPAQNNPPVTMLKYYPVKSKYFVGDTIWLDASESYDPDSLEGDQIIKYWWKGWKWTKCENLDDSTDLLLTSGRFNDIHEIIVVAEGVGKYEGGRYKISAWVEDKGHLKSTPEIVYLNVQRSPTADAGEDTVVAPGDTAWLEGLACDINPEDTTLGILWTQIEGPVSVTIIDSESVKTYFIPEDETYGGMHVFQLKVSDSDTFSIDTKRVIVDRYPVAVAFDSLAGFPAEIDSIAIDTNYVIDTIVVNSDTTYDTTDVVFDADTIPVPTPLPLDASLSFDPDSAFGDSVKGFIWEGISFTTCGRDSLGRVCRDTSVLKIFGLDSTKEVQSFPAKRGGGLYEVSLYVIDKYGVRSKNTDTLLISVQLSPEADAGPDTIILPGSYAYLHGSACEVNWDQVNSLKYRWFQDPGNPLFPLSIDSLNPETDLIAGKSGIYRFYLRVTDASQASGWDDTVKVIVNSPPMIDSILPDFSQVRFKEGGLVELRVFAHDKDTEVFGDSLTFDWTATDWPGFPGNTYQPAITGATEDIAEFVPLKHGTYEFEIVVHDTLSSKQWFLNPRDPSVMDTLNWDKVTVTVDTTFAYPIITGNLISFNTAGSKGGGIDCRQQSSPEIINNIFYKNKSGSSGGAICARSLSAPNIERNIFFGNISGDSTGGAIADLKAELSPGASIGFRWKTEITNNDFWDNAGGDIYQPPADVFGNIYVYPRLIDPDYGDFGLECSSPCLDDSIGLLLWLYPETCDTVPPLSVMWLSLFQHPVATAVAHFLVNTDVPLKAPPEGWVKMGESSPAPVDFISISSTTYRGKFVFTTSGTAKISIFGSSIQEVPDTITKDFTVQLIGAGKIGKLVSHDNWLRVSFPPGAVKGEIYATCIPVSDDPQYNFEDEDKVASGEAYHLGPTSDFEKELTISFPLDDYDLTEKDKTLFSIYRYEKNSWEKQASFLDENSICAKVKELGVYRLVYDAKQEHITGIPKTYQLFQNYPNPFNPQTMIKYDLPNPGHVNIAVYNILGQKVKSLVDEHQEAGHQSVNWDGKDDRGKEVASGIYFYKIKTVAFEKTKKMVLLK